MTVKVSDFIVRFLEHYGADTVFMVTGGGAMHLDDSFGKSKKIARIFNHHEQGSSIAAEGYARTQNKLAVVCVTTGPGGLNSLNGVFGAWTDSAPVLYISGQVKTATSLAACPQIPLRQLCDQEANIVRVVTPLTKFAKTVYNPADIQATLEEAVFRATEGRPGPVWVDVPINVQAAQVDPKKLTHFKKPRAPKFAFSQELTKAVACLTKAQKPLIVAGNGVRLSRTQDALEKLLKQTRVPVVTTFSTMDLFSSNHPQLAGRIGTVGQRAGNLTLQQADVVLFLGTRNNIRQVSYNWENFAKHATKIIVDIDAAELQKPTVKPDIAIHGDLQTVLPALAQKLTRPLGAKGWLSHTQKLRRLYPPLREFSPKPNDKVHPYLFMDVLGKLLPSTAYVAASNGTACVAFHQACESKKGQRLLFNSGDASMGYGLPAALGMCVANGRKKTVCLEGDGSIMMALQELQTVKTNRLPLKIFVLKNGEYMSIIQTQRNFFNGRLTGCNASSGVEVPDFVKVAKAFGLPAVRITKNKDLKKQIARVLAAKGPVVCEVVCTSDYIFAPKLSAKKMPDGTLVSPSLEDMFPFLSPAEMQAAQFKG